MSRLRFYHRMMGHVLWIPLLGFTTSGLYHLLQYTDNDNPRGLQLGQPVALHTLPDTVPFPDNLAQQALNNITLLTDGQQLLFRISFLSCNSTLTVFSSKRREKSIGPQASYLL